MGNYPVRCVTAKEWAKEECHQQETTRLLSDMNAGQFIRPYFCGCCRPTCADAILLVAESPDELQAQLDVVFAFSTQKRYRIHPQKSKIVITGDTNPQTTSNRWYLGDEPLEITNNCTHLGLERATSQHAYCINMTYLQ